MEQKTTKSPINSDVIFALIFVFFSIGLLLIIPHQIEKPLAFIGNPESALNPDLFPQVVGSSLLGVSLWYLVRSFFRQGTELDIDLDKKGLFNVAVTLAVFIAYALLMEPFGFIETSAMALAILVTFFGNRNVFIIGGVSLGIPLVIYYLFTRQLLVSLPESYLSSVLDNVLTLFK